MKALQHLFSNNRAWAEQMTRNNPEFFRTLARQQSPEYLWIGCSDSRVPANEIVGLLPGELFVHRNVANLVLHTDLNCLSVLQYAVDVLQVKHVIVCGHYGCGGVRAAMEDTPVGLADNWLRPIRDLWHDRRSEMTLLLDADERADRLCELNVMAQVVNVSNTTIVQHAWRRKQALMVHGWIYGIGDGLLKDLGICVGAAEELENIMC
jgi:carbonic anhydrase